MSMAEWAYGEAVDKLLMERPEDNDPEDTLMVQLTKRDSDVITAGCALLMMEEPEVNDAVEGLVSKLLELMDAQKGRWT